MSDNLDQIINDAFADLEASERDAWSLPPGSAAVRRTVAHHRRVRAVGISVAAAVLVAVPMVLAATVLHGNNSPPVGATGTPTTTQSPSPTVSPTLSVDPAAVRNATLTFPPFPGGADVCGGGDRTFVDGVWSSGSGVTWTIGALAPIPVDLDGVPGDELLTSVSCAAEPHIRVAQVVALKVGDGAALSMLGYVINSPDHPTLTFSNVRLENGVVLIDTNGPPVTDGWGPCTPQTRGYAYRDGQFAQVSGPTDFPRPDIHQDLRNSGLRIGINNPPGSGGGTFYCVAMVDGTGVAQIHPDNDFTRDPVTATFSVGPVTYATAPFGEVAVAVVTWRSTSGDVMGQSVQAFSVDPSDGAGVGVILGWVVVQTGADGVTAIASAQGSADQVVVTLTAGGSDQTWTYRSPDTSNGPWQR